MIESDAEQINEPEWPTQLQQDKAEIARLRAALRRATDCLQSCLECCGQGFVDELNEY